MHLPLRCLDRPPGPSFRSEMEKDVQQEVIRFETGRAKVHHRHTL